jgi:hypothetical protein
MEPSKVRALRGVIAALGAMLFSASLCQFNLPSSALQAKNCT